MPRSSARKASGLTTSSSACPSVNGTDSSSRRCDSIFEKSRMSLTIVSSELAWLRMVARKSAWAGVGALSSASAVMPMMPFIGVRISWLMFARNSLFARFAASAASLAFASSSWPRLRSVQSRVMTRNPTGRP